MKRFVIAVLVALVIPALCLAENADAKSDKEVGKTQSMKMLAVDVLPTVVEKVRFLTIGREGEFYGLGEGAVESRRNDWMEFFSQMGVEWPEGSGLKYVPAIGKVIITNTDENLKKFEEILAVLNVIPNQIEIELQFVEFKLSDIEVLAKRGMVNAASLMELWQKGDGRLLHAPKVVTQSGVEATVKGVTEYIYPTEFNVTPITGQSSNDITNIIGGIVEPGGFETREVGSILKVTPEVSRDGRMICVTMSPEAVSEPTWKNYCEAENAGGRGYDRRMELPFFHTQTMNTTICVANGKRVMLAGGMPNRTNDKLAYCFVTARLVDMEGNPLNKPDMSGTQTKEDGKK